MIATTLLILLLIFTGAAQAQPVAAGAVNVASFASPELPNGSLAQGSMFTVFGSNLGPGTLDQVSSFPLPTELAGTSIQVTIGDTIVDCIMIFTLAGQIAAILPSDTPVGDGTLTVTFNGQTSAPLPITVVEHSFGIFAINQAGSGPGVFTDPAFVANTLVHSATPSSVWTIWGTGIGAVAGDERGGPLPGDLADRDVQVFVGGQPATIRYRGRSGCCAGIDQIAFDIPAGVTGCYVPVVVVVEGVASNFATISIAESGEVCSDAVSGGYTAAELERAQADGSLRLGTISLNRIRLSLSGALPFQNFELITDTAAATFGVFDVSRLVASQGISGISTFGACVVLQFRGDQPQIEDPVQPMGLDAGRQLQLSGPQGRREIESTETGFYAAQLSGGTLPGFLRAALKSGPVPVDQLSQGYLESGEYTISGPGGADVGPFTTSFVIPELLTWTNRDQILSVPRSRDLTITWSGGGQDGAVQIFGFSAASVDDDVFNGALFICREDVSAGSFNVPSIVLSALPASTTFQNIAAGALGVGSFSNVTRFDADGIDIGALTHTDLELKTVGYQ